MRVNQAAFQQTCKEAFMSKEVLFDAAPSTPELQTKGSSKESLAENACKRYSSFQGLGQVSLIN